MSRKPQKSAAEAQLDRERAERLRIARERHFETASEAAEAMGVNINTYIGHENGSRGYKSSAEKYAKRFGVAPEWLLWARQTPNRLYRALNRIPEPMRPNAEDLAADTIERFYEALNKRNDK